MRIALDEIDPHIADMVRGVAPGNAARAPASRTSRPRLSRRRRAALAAGLTVPPILGLQFALFAVAHHSAFFGLSPYVVWFGTWALGSGAASRVLLKGRLGSRRAVALTTFNALSAPILGFAAACTVFGLYNTPHIGFYLLWLMFSLSAVSAGNHIALNVAPQTARITELQPESLTATFASFSLTRAERVYCDVLLFLARAQSNPDAEQTMRETLRQLNDLMQSSRQLEEQRLSLIPLLGANVVPELRTEYDRLKLRLETATDPMTRVSLEQSRRMVLSRIENAHNLQIGLERLNTQQEAITQTLSSALSSLGRMHLTADLRADTNTDFAMNDITESVTQMNRQTIAVESAVEEVLTLRSSG